MGTCNFHTSNASNTFVVDYGDDEDMWMESQEHLGDLFEHNLGEKKDIFYKSTALKSDDELRSFPASSIGAFSDGFEYLGIDVSIDVKVFLRGGYYSVANLDWEISVAVDNETYSCIEDAISDDEYNYGCSEGIWAIHKKRFFKKIEELGEKLVSLCEGEFEKVSECYIQSATMSDGTCFYSKCEEVA